MKELFKYIKNFLLDCFITNKKKLAYIKSFKQMAKDEAVLSFAEEGMEEYLTQIKAVE